MSGDGNKCQEHIACSYAYQIVSSRLYVGVDAADHLLNTLQEDFTKYIMPLIENDVDMIWNDEAKEKFEPATHVSQEQYEYAEDAWMTLECNTMKDYHYVVTDMLLLADVFEDFRKIWKPMAWIPFIIIACLVYPGTRCSSILICI